MFIQRGTVRRFFQRKKVWRKKEKARFSAGFHPPSISMDFQLVAVQGLEPRPQP